MRRGTTGFPVLSYTFLPGKGNHLVSRFISLIFTGKGNHLVSGLTISSNTCILLLIQKITGFRNICILCLYLLKYGNHLVSRFILLIFIGQKLALGFQVLFYANFIRNGKPLSFRPYYIIVSIFRESETTGLLLHLILINPERETRVSSFTVPLSTWEQKYR